MTHDRPGGDLRDGPAATPEAPAGTPGAPAPNQDQAAVHPEEPKPLSRRQMLDQLEAMARQIAADTPPVLKQSAATLAEWAATAARSTGPLARRLAEITDDASLRIAERSQRLAADLRAEVAAQEAAEEDPALPPSDRD